MRKQRKKAKVNRSSSTRMGLGWYRREQWPRLREVSADRDSLEETYEEWLDSAEAFLQRMAALGQQPAKVDIDVEELVLWCQAQNRPVNAPARSEYTAWKMRRQADSGSG